MYYILSLERSGKNRRVWWKPNRHGYTEDLAEAGVYGLAEAIVIITTDIHGNDIPVPAAFAETLDANVRAHHVSDRQT